ncbi:hypothetical protein [Enterobacter hormaechei]|uniref:hypothetical protein n=1 Tax=Enterobacter hormaechei TaxID=158836 RepID=UPI001F180534|nr:hypothetical protein [Enterobacter hormaechei]
MKMLSGINIPFFKKSKKDENGDLEQSYVKKDESAKGRFLDIKKRFSPQAEASGAGITYSALINRDTKLIRINTVSIAVIGLLVAKILFFTDPVTIVTPPNMNEEITVVGNKALMNPLMILVKIIKLRWIHILSYDQMVSRKINNQTTRCANSIFYTTLFTNSAPNYT